MNRRKLLTTALAVSVCSLLPVKANASTILKFKTLRFSAFYSIDEAVKVEQCRVTSNGFELGFFTETIYNWYTKSYTYKRLAVVSYRYNSIDYRFVCNSLDSSSVAIFFRENGLEYSAEIKELVTSSFSAFKAYKNEEFNYSRFEITSIEKYFKPTVYTMVPKRETLRYVNPRVTGLSITLNGVEPEITYQSIESLGQSYSKCYVVNIPSEIMGELSQIECSKGSDSQWQLKITKHPTYGPVRSESVSATNVVYTPIFKGIEENAGQVISGKLGVNEYFFTQRVTRYFQSILK